MEKPLSSQAGSISAVRFSLKYLLCRSSTMVLFLSHKGSNMKYSLLLVVLVTAFGISACNKPAAAAYSGPDKAGYDAAVEKCKVEAFDSRDRCVKDTMAGNTFKKS
jgi:hypothetical protein